MLDAVAIENVKNDYSVGGYELLTVEKVTKHTLNDLLTTCDSTKHMEERVEWYDDEDRPDYNSWLDVEGEGYGWLWLRKENEPSEWHSLLKENLIKFVEIKGSTINDTDEYVIIVNRETQTIYHFIERESSKCDTIYTFSNEEIDY